MTIVQYNEGVNVERLSKYMQSIWHGRVLYSVIVAGLVMLYAYRLKGPEGASRRHTWLMRLTVKRLLILDLSSPQGSLLFGLPSEPMMLCT